MRAGERRRASRSTRFGWPAWLLRVVAWGLAGLEAAWGPAGLGTVWRGVLAPGLAAVLPGKGGSAEGAPGGAGWEEWASAPGRSLEEASGRGRPLEVCGLGRLSEEASGLCRLVERVSDPGTLPGDASDLGRTSQGVSDPGRPPEGASDLSRPSEGVSDPNRWPEDACDPSGLSEASGVALREVDRLARFLAAGCGEGDAAVVAPLAPVVLCLRPLHSGALDWDWGRPHAIADLHVGHPPAGVLHVDHPRPASCVCVAFRPACCMWRRPPDRRPACVLPPEGSGPRLSAAHARAGRQGSPRTRTPLRGAAATAFRSPRLTANRSASVNRGVTRDRPAPFTCVAQPAAGPCHRIDPALPEPPTPR